ncbi:MAG: hypothetical protein HOQ45_02405 [Nocardioidaceae bacterium]|nr:hypothetical protein [Dermatophilaceae bacterium]NUR05846.1 hypothetical protein [Nocardioidaceae bacterium]NUR80036.1 hypothetical protein [Dermatophilaceae bacterium]
MARIRSSDQGVRVQGLAELNRALRGLGKEHQRELKETNVKVSQAVAQHAQQRAYSLGGVAAHVAPTIKGGGGTTWAGIKFGSGHPEAAGAEFGAYRFKQFKPWRGNGSDAGYFVYPMIRADADDITERYEAALDDLLRKYDFI